MKKCYTLVMVIVVSGTLTGSGADRAVADDESKGDASKVTFDDHIRPIFREHCFSCHNQNQAKSGLALDSYATVIEGGSSGEVVFEDDLDSSRLWTLVSHQEDPVMPPGQDKLADDKLALISKWIEQGMPENSGASAPAKKKAVNLAIVPSVGKPEGPVAMPEGLSLEPVVYTKRASATAAVAASPWAPLVAISGQEQVLLYHTDTAALLGVLPFPEGIAYSLRFSRDGSKLLAGGGRGGYAGCAVLFDVRTGARLAKVGDELDAVLAADVNPELTRVALGGPGRIVRIYSTESGELLHEIRKHTDWIYAVRFSPDGVLLASADRSNGLFVWEADTAREYLDLRGHTAAVLDVAWRDDSNVLASASLDGTARLWEMNDGKQIARASAHGGGVNAVCIAHDGKVATAGGDRTCKLWDPALKPLKTFPKFAEPALEVALTHDGKRIIAGDWAGQVKMWDAAEAKEVAVLSAHPMTVAVRLQQLQKQLQLAVEADAKRAIELMTLQKRISEVNAEVAEKVRVAEQKVQQANAAIEQGQADQAERVSQLNSASKEVQESQAGVQQARKALEAANARLAAAQTALASVQEQEQTSRQNLSAVEKKLQAARSALNAARSNGQKQFETVGKELPAKKAAAQAARDLVLRLEVELRELELERARK